MASLPSPWLTVIISASTATMSVGEDGLKSISCTDSDRSTITFFVMPSVSAIDSDRLVTISLTALSANDIVSESEIILDFIVELLSVKDTDSNNF